MHGAIAAVALRNATMEMNRDKHRMRHLKSNKTIRMSFASTRSLAVGSVRALYGAAMTKVDRLLRKDRFKNEVHALPFCFCRLRRHMNGRGGHIWLLTVLAVSLLRPGHGCSGNRNSPRARQYQQ